MQNLIFVWVFEQRCGGSSESLMSFILESLPTTVNPVYRVHYNLLVQLFHFEAIIRYLMLTAHGVWVVFDVDVVEGKQDLVDGTEHLEVGNVLSLHSEEVPLAASKDLYAAGQQYKILTRDK